MERLLAIFYSIIGHYMDGNIEIQTELATLIQLRLIHRLTPSDKLDGMKCKCNVSFDRIKAISASVRFDILKYLVDFDV